MSKDFVIDRGKVAKRDMLAHIEERIQQTTANRIRTIFCNTLYPAFSNHIVEMQPIRILNITVPFKKKHVLCSMYEDSRDKRIEVSALSSVISIVADELQKYVHVVGLTEIRIEEIG